jgi:hypothetical protein
MHPQAEQFFNAGSQIKRCIYDVTTDKAFSPKIEAAVLAGA